MRRVVSLVVAGSLAACALAPASAVAAGAPLITRFSVLEFEFGDEVSVNGDINPNELQTTYTIHIECPDHELCQQTEGTLPAIAEPQDVSLKLTNPRPAGTYQLTLAAQNADGKTYASLPFKLPFLAACTVPSLKGDTLAAARRALARAHCQLGTVHRPAHRHGELHVSAQGAPAGKRLAHNALVVLWLGAKRASHRG